MSDPRTIEQDRVARALTHTDRLDPEKAEDYFREAAGFGPLAVSSGLAGAAAFYAEKSKSSFFKNLQEWVVTRPQFSSLPGETLLAKIGDKGCTAATYRLMTQEALLYTNWLKRLAGAKRKEAPRAR
jgi:hypothetical protein